MDKWVEHIPIYVILLSESGKYDHKISEHIVLLAMTTGGDGNEDWKSELCPFKNKLHAKYSGLGLYSTLKDMDDDFHKVSLYP